MRDIRSDLAERVTLLKDQIDAATRELELQLNRIKQEHEGSIAELRADLDAVKTVLELEQRRLHNGPAMTRSSETPVQTKPKDKAGPQPRLLDILIRRLSDDGPASSGKLHHWAVQEGYLDDGDASRSALHKVLTETAEAGFIRQLPDGKFAAPSITDLLRLQRTV